MLDGDGRRAGADEGAGVSSNSKGIKRRRLVRAAALLTLTAPAASLGQANPGASDVKGILAVGAASGNPGPRGFVQGLDEHRLVNGRDFSLRFFDAAGPPLAAELERQRTDIIFAAGSRGVNMARTATRTIPIVCIDLESEPLADGLIRSFARPGGNITGVFLDQPSLTTKWLQYLLDTLPGLERVAVLRQPGLSGGQWRMLEAQASRSRLTLQPFGFDEATLDRAFADVVASRPQALIILSSPLVVTLRARIAALALAARLPSITMFRIYAEAGGLMAYGPDPFILGHRAASYVVRVLRGTAPGDLPVEQPSRFEFAVNNQTARTIGVTMPPWMMMGADLVVE